MELGLLLFGPLDIMEQTEGSSWLTTSTITDTGLMLLPFGLMLLLSLLFPSPCFVLPSMDLTLKRLEEDNNTIKENMKVIFFNLLRIPITLENN